MLQAALSTCNQSENLSAMCEGLRRMIVKLRWMGMDMEADTLCHQLENVSPEECAPTCPQETD